MQICTAKPELTKEVQMAPHTTESYFAFTALGSLCSAMRRMIITRTA